VASVVQIGDKGGLEVAVGCLRRLAPNGLAQALGGAVEEGLAIGEDQHSPAVALGLLDVVGGEDHRCAAPRELADELPQPSPLAWVEPNARLIEEQDDRPGKQADRDVDPLLVTAGEAGDDLPPALIQPGQLEHLRSRSGGVGQSLQPSKEQEVLLDGEAPVKRGLLRHPADLPAGELHLTLIGLDDPGQDREQGCLSGSVWPDHCQQFARVSSKVNPAQGSLLAEALGQPPRLKSCCLGPGTHRRNATRPRIGEMSFPATRMRRLRRSEPLRGLVRETELSPAHLIQPAFVVAREGVREAIDSMPGVERYSISELVAEATEIAASGIGAILLFGIPSAKDESGSGAYDDEGVVQMALRALKEAHPNLVVITDVCLCEYTSHGHCGFIRNGEVDNDITIELLAKAAVSHAEAGADAVAPSDMMDGRVGTIRSQLDEEGHSSVPILAYSAKYASAFYGPFREAAESTPEFGDRRGYQLDPANAAEAIREAELDLEEGADMLMVKPATPYLDVLRRIKETTSAPLAAYHVSGEYSMLKAAAANGWIEERAAVLETLTSIRRAGADAIVTYYAKEAARWLQ
jgi:porphobilinogen synthase